MSEKEELVSKIKAKIEKYQKLLEEITIKDNPILEKYTEVEKRVKSKKPEPKYVTGVQWLDDNLNGGFTQGSFINLAGVSFSGKSTLALKILANVAEYKKVVFFSLEMYENILVKELENKLNKTQKENLLIVQKGYDVEVIESIIREQAKKGVKFFVIDSKMKVKTNFDGKEHQQISRLSNMFARLTQELGIILLLINQISEEDRKNNKFGLKGSGDQVYDSDVILYIYIKIDKERGERRICSCVKDRYNKRKWNEDITEPLQNNRPTMEVEYHDKKLDIPKL